MLGLGLGLSGLDYITAYIVRFQHVYGTAEKEPVPPRSFTAECGIERAKSENFETTKRSSVVEESSVKRD